MNKELQELYDKECFKEVDRSSIKGREIVPSKWTLKLKRKPDGSILKYKGRLVIRGDRQREGLEEGETVEESDGYSPVVDWGTLRLLLTLSIQHNLKTTQVDFHNAFVQSPLDRPMYMEYPEGMKNHPKYKGKILKLKRSLYGHKFAAKLFYKLLVKNLGKLNMKPSSLDHCLFVGKERPRFGVGQE